jgi:tetratricopeptide (TPR) repeat protein
MFSAVLAAALLFGAPTQALDRAGLHLAAFRADEALAELRAAQRQGPFTHAEHVRLYAQLGVAHAYLGDKEAAAAAFGMALALEPSFGVSYTLSPKVTFLFEQARGRAGRQPPPTVALSWPHDLEVGEPVPIDVEVLSDPKGFLARGILLHRLRGGPQWQSQSFAMPAPGEYTRIVLPAVAPDAVRPERLQLYLTVQDGQENEVLVVGSADVPREINLAYDPPAPLYTRWWLWAAIGGAVAIGATTAGILLTREPPDEIGGSFRVAR